MADYRKRSGPLLVDGGTTAPGAIGTAFDFEIRMLLDPDFYPLRDVRVRALSDAEVREVFGVIVSAQNAAHAQDMPALDRACMALAHCMDLTGLHYSASQTPIWALKNAGALTTESILGLVTEDAQTQLAKLRSLAMDKLLPTLPGPHDLAPDLPMLMPVCAADADLISGGLLVELKTNLGLENKKTHVRTNTLQMKALYQLVSYVLFDLADDHRLTDFGVYSARYGNLISWPIQEAFEIMAGLPVDLHEERTLLASALLD